MIQVDQPGFLFIQVKCRMLIFQHEYAIQADFIKPLSMGIINYYSAEPSLSASIPLKAFCSGSDLRVISSVLCYNTLTEKKEELT